MSNFFLKSNPGEIKVGLDGVDPDEAGVAPVFSSPPAWVGGASAQVGVEMTITPGVVTGTPAPSVVRELVRGATVVSTLGSLAYTPIEADIGEILYVRETASNGTLPDAVSTSSGTAEVLGASVVGLSDWSASNALTLRANVLPAQDEMTLLALVKVVNPTKTFSRVVSKGAGGSDGWAITFVNTGTGRLRVGGGGHAAMEITLRAEDYGKWLLVVYRRTATTADVSVTMDNGGTLYEAVSVVATAAVDNAHGPAIGCTQVGTAGTIDGWFSESAIAGFGYSSQRLSDEEVQTLGAAAFAQGTIPSDASFPGAVSVYQAANGLSIDQVGSNDMTLAGALTSAEDATPTYVGKSYTTMVRAGQSNEFGWVPFGNFSNGHVPPPSDDGTDFTAALPACKQSRFGGAAFSDLDDSADIVGTSSRVSLGRAMVARGVPNPHIVEHAVGGTSLHTDWVPVTGPQWVNFTTITWPTMLASLHPFDRLDVVGCTWGQWESDVDDTNGPLYGGRLIAFMTAMEAFLAPYLNPNFRWALTLVSSAQTGAGTAPQRAVVLAQQLDVVAARSNVRTIGTNNATMEVGAVHFDAPTIVKKGYAEDTVIFDNADVSLAA